MKWHNQFDWTEIILLCVFLVFYIAFFLRTYKAAQLFNHSGWKVIIKFLLRSVYFALLIIALLGPSFGEGTREVKSIGKDIFIAIDLSESMNARDIQPSRLAKLKYELKNIVDAFSSDRIGLIMFSNEAFLQCPLTYDKNALNLFIETLNTNLVPKTGTDFGPPLKLALEKLESEQSTVTQPKSKIIIMISDGEDFGDETDKMAEKIQNAGIKLFSLGIGTEKGSKLLFKRGFKKDKNGKPVISKLNPKSLKKLASDTDGKYFEINESGNDVDRLINTIDFIEGELRDTMTLDVTSNRYYIFLSLALFLMVVDLLVNVKLIKLW